MTTEESTTTIPKMSEQNGEAGAGGSGGNNSSNKKGNQNRQRKNPEELYDLTQPIPKVDKPNKEQHEAEVEAINTEIESLKTKKQLVQDKIDTGLDGGNRNSASSKPRDELQQLRRKKGQLIDEKKAIKIRLDSVKRQSDNLINEQKATKANMKFNSLTEIEAQIKNLKKIQETTSMTLMEEKRLLRDIESLQLSKTLVGDLSNKEKDIDDAKTLKKTLTADVAAKDKEIDAVQKEIDEKQKVVDALKDTEKEARMNLDTYKAEREDLKKQIGAKLDQRNALKDAFREASDKWFDYQRALKAQKRIKIEEEKQKREEERQAYLKLLEEEEAKKTPYEEEMALCDYLADYLTRTYISDDDAKKNSDSKKSDFVQVQDDPFAGLVPVNKKAEGDAYFNTEKGKKKPRARNTKKQKDTPVFKLNIDSFEQFGLLNLTPPTSVEMVPNSVEELKAKKVWYSQQPRGSVPTAQDIRKANEKAAATFRQDKQSNKKGGKLDLTGDDFAPLSSSATTSSTINASWGQKVLEKPTVVSGDDAAAVAGDDAGDVAASE